MARRLQVLQGHLQREQDGGSGGIGQVQLSAFQAGPHLVEYDAECGGLDRSVARTVLTPGALTFVAELVHEFRDGVAELYKRRGEVQAQVEAGTYRFDFLPETARIRQGNWRVAPIPPVMLDRRVDVGDVSPDDAKSLVEALNCGAQGIQCDFDDGFCPAWRNVLLAVHNIALASRGELAYPGANGCAIRVKPPGQTGVMMLRPRAWCMTEFHLHVNGRAVPGPLVDFGLLIYHCGKELEKRGTGPFFYCSKVESYLEARLWNAIFSWAEAKLGLTQNAIKACVLIENITASFQMDEILYELREHSAGLNCGIWDYSASFIARFAQRSDMVFPDRTKYVNMKCDFMRAYMRLLVDTCHKRGAPATTGMAALVTDPAWDASTRQERIAGVEDAKVFEAEGGADGALIYDTLLQPVVQRVFDRVLGRGRVNQLDRPLDPSPIGPAELLKVPPGGITLDGVRFNVAIGLRFIESWLRGRGSFVYRSAAEDSATAEISRSQIWQWVRHGLRTEEGQQVTLELVYGLMQQTAAALWAEGRGAGLEKEALKARIQGAVQLYRNLVSAPEFPRFITTYLYEQALFQQLVRRAPVS